MLCFKLKGLEHLILMATEWKKSMKIYNSDKEKRWDMIQLLKYPCLPRIRQIGNNCVAKAVANSCLLLPDINSMGTPLRVWLFSHWCAWANKGPENCRSVNIGTEEHISVLSLIEWVWTSCLEMQKCFRKRSTVKLLDHPKGQIMPRAPKGPELLCSGHLLPRVRSAAAT